MRFASAWLALTLLPATALAQLKHVIPNGTDVLEGSTANAFPWGRAGAGIRIQTIYDSSNFTAHGINFPIVITGLRWRPNGGVASAASSFATGATVMLSTCPINYASATTTFAANQGADLTTCFSGPVSWPAQAATTPPNPSPSPFLINTTFTTPFTYNPSLGDLVIETDIPIQTFTGTTGLQLDVHGTAPQACRAYLTTGYLNAGPNATGTAVDQNHGVVVEVTYTPVSGLFAEFTAVQRYGNSPFAAQFNAQAFSSDPGGVTSYAWDLDGDSVVDSTLQNPAFTYNTCGTYNVSLTVTDASHSPYTYTRTGYIVTDSLLVPSFTSAPLGGNTFQFTDTTIGSPTSWAWDFDGDNVTDSTVQNPVWAYTPGCTKPPVKLTVNRLCRGPFVTNSIGAPHTAICSTMGGNNGNASPTSVGNMFDLVVNNPQGITVCSLTVTPYTFSGAFTCDVFVTPGTYVGNHATPAVWRQVGTGPGTAIGGTTVNPNRILVALAQPFYLPPGNYGMAVYITRNPVASVNIAYSNAPIGPFSNGDVTFAPNPAGAPGIASLGTATVPFFSTTTTPGRLWNGILHYSTVANGGEAGYGFFGPGCPGTLGIPGNTCSAQPRLGQVMTANLSGLQNNAAFFILGFSRTSSIFGPLPFNLTSLGAPNCFGRVSTDSVMLIAGAGNTAAFNLGVPNNAIYLGNQLFTQGLSIDAVNALGGVTTDAAAFIVGQ